MVPQENEWKAFVKCKEERRRLEYRFRIATEAIGMNYSKGEEEENVTSEVWILLSLLLSTFVIYNKHVATESIKILSYKLVQSEY